MASNACAQRAHIQSQWKLSSPRISFKPSWMFTGIAISLALCTAGAYSFRIIRAASVFGFMHHQPQPLRVYDRVFGHRSEIKDIAIAGTLGPVELRIYTPLADSHPKPVLLVHGFAPDGNRDGYLNRVAKQLSEMGYLVVLPYVPAETKFEMLPSDMTVIDDAIRWSARTTGQKVSVFGISFSAGLSITAALQPAVRGDVKLIFALSGFNNLETIARYYIREPVTGPGGKPYPPLSAGPLLIATPYLQELVPPADLSAIRAELDELKLIHGTRLTIDDPSAAKLTKSQQLELKNLGTVGTPQMQQLYLNAIARHRNELAAISPSSVLPNLDVPLYVLHGESDRTFPEEEIEWMKKEVAGNPNAHFLVSPWVTHASVGSTATIWQKFVVVNYGAQLLHEVSRSEPVFPQSLRPQVQSAPSVAGPGLTPPASSPSSDPPKSPRTPSSANPPRQPAPTS